MDNKDYGDISRGTTVRRKSPASEDTEGGGNVVHAKIPGSSIIGTCGYINADCEYPWWGLVDTQGGECRLEANHERSTHCTGQSLGRVTGIEHVGLFDTKGSTRGGGVVMSYKKRR